MTLCQKLEELGYKKYPFLSSRYYYKKYLDLDEIAVVIYLTDIVIEDADIQDYGVLNNNCIIVPTWFNQSEINYMQIAFNRVQKDVKEIKKWQKQVAKYSK